MQWPRLWLPCKKSSSSVEVFFYNATKLRHSDVPSCQWLTAVCHSPHCPALVNVETRALKRKEKNILIRPWEKAYTHLHSLLKRKSCSLDWRIEEQYTIIRGACFPFWSCIEFTFIDEPTAVVKNHITSNLFLCCLHDGREAILEQPHFPSIPYRLKKERVMRNALLSCQIILELIMSQVWRRKSSFLSP